ncbi:DUF2336 domain-containing protein [Aureimonas leprariae]|uniref:DUF2336 domain-containing protein n=1 Tax=Plantimonas leprariae TaxID=2615207 RepID=UPI0013868487|nr:DUF2336 domain-containing protein [Aureimonas leprariae]
MDRDAASNGLYLALDDPSPKVRLTVADAVAESAAAPRALVKGLLLDIDEIAARVALSPVLTSEDLRDALVVVREPVRAAIAARPRLGAVAVALARVGGIAASLVLAANDCASMPAATFRCMAERWGGNAALRSLLLERHDLPADVRQTLILEAGHALQHSAFVAGVLGVARSSEIAFEACARATAAMAEWLDGRDMPSLIDHLRTSGQLTPAFLIRITCSGNIDLLAASLAALSGLSERRVRAVVVEARQGPFRSLARDCGLDESAAALLHLATRQWKEVATGAVSGDVRDVSAFVMRRVVEAFRALPGCRPGDTTRFLRQLEGESARDAARNRRELLLAA